MKNLFKRMRVFIQKVCSKISAMLLEFADSRKDRRICGRSLVKYVRSVDRDDQNGLGGTGSQSTHYIFLKRIFSHVRITESDTFIDVGCGKGRVLAFLLHSKCPCAIYGIEHNEKVGRIAVEWTQRYPQASVIIGDAFEQDYNNYTILSLARSFLPVTFLRFVEKLENTLTHPITLVYWYESESGHLLRSRPGWSMQFREVVGRIHGLRISRYPQSYSIWTYDPAQHGEIEKDREESGGKARR